MARLKAAKLLQDRETEIWGMPASLVLSCLATTPVVAIVILVPACCHSRGKIALQVAFLHSHFPQPWPATSFRTVHLLQAQASTCRHSLIWECGPICSFAILGVGRCSLPIGNPSKMLGRHNIQQHVKISSGVVGNFNYQVPSRKILCSMHAQVVPGR